MDLFKRIPRDIKQNFLRYFILFLLVVVSMGLVVSMSNSTDSINHTIDKYRSEDNIEDGEFSVYLPLTDENVLEINDLGIEIEKTFYIDIEEGDKTFRMFSVRNSINLLHADAGKVPTSEKEIFIDKNYARLNEIGLNDYIIIADTEYCVVGIGSTPDYGYMLKNYSDTSSNQVAFTTAFMSNEDFDKIKETNESQMIYNYSYKLSDHAEAEDLKDYLTSVDFDYQNIKDTYILGLIEEVNDIRDSLVGGGEELSSAIEEIRQASGDLESGLSDIAVALNNVINSYSLDPSVRQIIFNVVEQQNLAVGATQEIGSGLSELYDGSVDLHEGNSELIDEAFNIDYVNLSSFLESKYNNRINAANNDAAISKTSGLLVGVVISILIAFIFCMFALNSIEKESSIIGTLYSLGFVKKQLILYYLIPPVLIVIIGSICGMLVGFKLVDFMVLSNSEMYSYPNIELAYPLYLFIYAIVIPVILVIVINFFILIRKLSTHPLQLLRKENKDSKTISFKPSKMNFYNTFQIKQLLKESRNSILMLIGLFISIFLMVWGFCIYSSIEYYIDHSTDNINNEYTYIFSNPVDGLYNDNTDNGVEKAFTKSFTIYFDMAETDLDVVLQGINNDSKYFDFAPDLEDKDNEVYVSSSAAIKFGYRTGDIITMSDPLENKLYAFKIAGEIEYGNGLYFFMNLDSMLSYFGLEDDYYNTLISNEKLIISESESNMLITSLSKTEISQAAETFRESMRVMEIIMIFGSIFIFILVMFLLMKLTIDNSSYHISLIKAFGYNNKEVRKMYLNGANIIVILAIILGLTLGHGIVSLIYPITVSDVSAGMPMHLSWALNIIIIALSTLTYIITRIILQRRLKLISITEMLKNRE